MNPGEQETPSILHFTLQSLITSVFTEKTDSRATAISHVDAASLKKYQEVLLEKDREGSAC